MKLFTLVLPAVLLVTGCSAAVNAGFDTAATILAAAGTGRAAAFDEAAASIEAYARRTPCLSRLRAREAFADRGVIVVLAVEDDPCVDLEPSVSPGPTAR